MRRPPIVFTAIFLACGSSFALTDDSRTGPIHGLFAGDTLFTLTVHEENSTITGDQLATLESKIKSLEARMNTLFPQSPMEQHELNLEDTPYDSNSVHMMQGWTSEEHVREATAHHQKAQDLYLEIQGLQNRIDRFVQKPYLGTKGFKRSRLKNLKGHLTQALREATTKTMWHTRQAEKMITSEQRL